MNVEDWLAKSHSVFLSDSSISEWLHPSRRESNTSDSGLPSPTTLADDLSSTAQPCPRAPETGCLTGWLTNTPGLQIEGQSFDTHILENENQIILDLIRLDTRIYILFICSKEIIENI